MSVEQVTVDIPTDPTVLKNIRDGLKEVSDSKLRANAERTLQTEIFTRLAKETNIPNNFLRRLATAVEEGGVDKMVREVNDVSAFHHQMMLTPQALAEIEAKKLKDLAMSLTQSQPAEEADE